MLEGNCHWLIIVIFSSQGQLMIQTLIKSSPTTVTHEIYRSITDPRLSEILAKIILYRTKHLCLIVEVVYQVMTNQYLRETAAPENEHKI